MVTVKDGRRVYCAVLCSEYGKGTAEGLGKKTDALLWSSCLVWTLGHLAQLARGGEWRYPKDFMLPPLMAIKSEDVEPASMRSRK